MTNKDIIEHKKIVTSKYKTIILCANLVTITNATMLPVLYYARYPYFRSWFALGLSIIGSICIGGSVAGLYVYPSYIMYNLVMLYVNLKLWRKKN